jgi:hypothetical protein
MKEGVNMQSLFSQNEVYKIKISKTILMDIKSKIYISVNYRDKFSDDELKALFDLTDLFLHLYSVVSISWNEKITQYQKEFSFHKNKLIEILDNPREYLSKNNFETTKEEIKKILNKYPNVDTQISEFLMNINFNLAKSLAISFLPTLSQTMSPIISESLVKNKLIKSRIGNKKFEKRPLTFSIEPEDIINEQ